MMINFPQFECPFVSLDTMRVHSDVIGGTMQVPLIWS